MKRSRKPRKRWVPFHLWIDAEPKGDLWIKGPRRIRLWQNPMWPRWGDDDGKEHEEVIVQ